MSQDIEDTEGQVSTKKCPPLSNPDKDFVQVSDKGVRDLARRRGYEVRVRQAARSRKSSEAPRLRSGGDPPSAQLSA